MCFDEYKKINSEYLDYSVAANWNIGGSLPATNMQARL